MRKIKIGRTGIEVTELCFGTLPMGPLQKDMPAEEASDVLAHALKSGINFVDTAQVYKTHTYVRKAMEKSGVTPVISTKSPALSYEDMRAAVEQALEEIGVRKLDIFFLHAARADLGVFEQRAGALKCLLEYREKGIITAVGISLHSVDVVNLAAEHPEIDIVFPLINSRGMGVLNGSREDMEQAINKCHDNGKGVFLMKVLAGGTLINGYRQSMDYITSFSAGRFPYAVGMVNKREVDMNLKYFRGEDISSELADTKIENKNFFVFKAICTRCGTCVEECHSDAITITDACEIDESKCLKCGYCVGACPAFAIRMI
ncbi:MAG: aldo/keto reductase [Defluviitaleaceae bacterium]|nr:aldo/keto reductase [Defluviitaleaceae bacterium]